MQQISNIAELTIQGSSGVCLEILVRKVYAVTQFRYKLKVKLVTLLDIWKETYEKSNNCVQSLLFADYQYHICLTEMSDSFMNERIWMYKVELSINRAKLNKAVGLYNIPNEMFKNTYSILFRFLYSE